jgi:hypothetical protein
VGPGARRSFGMRVAEALEIARRAPAEPRNRRCAVCTQPRFCATAAHAVLKTLEWRFASHGEADLRIEPVSGRLCRPPGIRAWPRAVSSLHRADARPDRQCVWPRHVRGHALLGRRPSRVGRGGTRLRGGVAAPAEMGGVALVAVGRPQRHTCHATRQADRAGPCSLSVSVSVAADLYEPQRREGAKES